MVFRKMRNAHGDLAGGNGFQHWCTLTLLSRSTCLLVSVQVEVATYDVFPGRDCCAAWAWYASAAPVKQAAVLLCSESLVSYHSGLSI